MNPLFRVSAWTLADGTAIRTCSAEDLLVFEAFAARDQDWLDVQGVALRQAGRLDAELIIKELAPLLDHKGTTEYLARLERLLAAARTPE